MKCKEREDIDKEPEEIRKSTLKESIIEKKRKKEYGIISSMYIERKLFDYENEK